MKEDSVPMARCISRRADKVATSALDLPLGLLLAWTLLLPVELGFRQKESQSPDLRDKYCLASKSDSPLTGTFRGWALNGF